MSAERRVKVPRLAAAEDSARFVPYGPAPTYGNDWRSVGFTQVLSVTGGYLKKPMLIESMEVEDEMFVKLEKNADWFLKMVGGPKLQKGGLQRTRAIETLRAKSGCGGPVPQAKTMDAGDDDPMNALDECIYEGDASCALKKKKPYYRPKRIKEKVVSVQMPTRALGRCDGETKSVRVLPRSKNSLWMHLGDLPWLVCYVADELSRDGVPDQPEPENSAAAVGNCSVAGLSIRWDFSSNDGWEAIWVDGPFKGGVVKSSVSALTPAKWIKVDGANKYGVDLPEASLKDRKNAVWALLEMHCDEMLRSKACA